MVKAYYLEAEISEMVAYCGGDVVVFTLKGCKYATIALMNEITLEAA